MRPPASRDREITLAKPSSMVQSVFPEALSEKVGNAQNTIMKKTPNPNRIESDTMIDKLRIVLGLFLSG